MFRACRMVLATSRCAHTSTVARRQSSRTSVRDVQDSSALARRHDGRDAVTTPYDDCPSVPATSGRGRQSTVTTGCEYRAARAIARRLTSVGIALTSATVASAGQFTPVANAASRSGRLGHGRSRARASRMRASCFGLFAHGTQRSAALPAVRPFAEMPTAVPLCNAHAANDAATIANVS